MESPDNKDYTADEVEQLFLNGAAKFLQHYNMKEGSGDNKVDYANSRKHEVIANYLTKRQEVLAKQKFSPTPGEQTVIDYGLNLVNDEEDEKCA